MDAITVAMAAITLLTAGTLFGIFRTKTPGFGRYSTSLLLLVLILFCASMFAALGRLEPQYFVNILFAITGFAGGLITAKTDA